MLSVMAHALHALRADSHEVQGIVLLQPTSPFRRDQLMLWLTAIGLPFLLTGLFKGLGMLFG